MSESSIYDLLGTDEARAMAALEAGDDDAEWSAALVAAALLGNVERVRSRAHEKLAGSSEQIQAWLAVGKRSHAAVRKGCEDGTLSEGGITKFVKSAPVDPAGLTYALLVAVCQQPGPYRFTTSFIEAARKHARNEPRIYGALGTATDVELTLKKQLPTGLSQLRALARLRLRGTLTSAKNMDELATLASFTLLDLWVKEARLDVCAAIAGQIRGLYFRGAVSALSDIAPLRDWQRLEALDIANTAVTDLAPIAGIGLQSINIEDAAVSNLGVLATMPSLREIRLNPRRFANEQLVALKRALPEVALSHAGTPVVPA